MGAVAEAIRTRLFPATSERTAIPTAEDQQLLKQVQQHLEQAATRDLDYCAQVELSNLIGCLNNIRARGRYDLLPILDLAILALPKSDNNPVLSERIRWQIDAALGMPFYMMPKAVLRDSTPAANVMLGVVSQFVICGIIALLVFILITSNISLPNINVVVRDGVPTTFQPALMLLLVILSGMFGSVLSIATRIADFSEYININPTILFLTGLLKPVIGIGSAIFVYAVLTAGFISVQIPNDKATAAWAAIAFVAGFSERLVPDVVEKLEAMLGASQESAQNPNPNTTSST